MIHFQMGNAGCFRKEPKDSLSFLRVCPLGRPMLYCLYLWFIKFSLYTASICGSIYIGI